MIGELGRFIIGVSCSYFHLCYHVTSRPGSQISGRDKLVSKHGLVYLVACG